MPLRIVVAEDNLLVREGILRLLSSVADLEVLRACDSYDAVVAAIEEEDPDVVLSDIRMPPTSSDEGIRLARELRTSHPHIGVVVVSQYSEPDHVLDLFERGSDGRAYLLKERLNDRATLVSAIRSVAAGDASIDSKIIDVLILARSGGANSRLAELTPREREVLAEIAKGKSNAAIAESLFLTKRAVEKHINAIFMKLNLLNPDDVSRRVKAALMFIGSDEEE